MHDGLTAAAQTDLAWAEHLNRGKLHYQVCTPDLRRRLAGEQGWRCCYRGCRMSDEPGHAQATFEHIVPRSLGGKSTVGNLVIACWQCNMERKSDWWPEHIEVIKIDGCGLAPGVRDVLDPGWRVRAPTPQPLSHSNVNG